MFPIIFIVGIITPPGAAKPTPSSAFGIVAWDDKAGTCGRNRLVRQAKAAGVRSVAHRDRASRFGGGAAVCYLRPEPSAGRDSRIAAETLAQDVREIITVFGARLHDSCSRRPQVAP